MRQREAAEAAAEAVLASSPRRLRKFRQLLADSQHLVPIREEQTAELTLPWPVMRRAVQRIGQALADNGALADPDDVFFLTRDEVLAALVNGGRSRHRTLPAAVPRARSRRRLVPPFLIGTHEPDAEADVGRAPNARRHAIGAALVSGSPASAGSATGAVRVVRGPDEFDTLQSGEIRGAADGSGLDAALHACGRGGHRRRQPGSARVDHRARDGIPAIVGCGDATARLTTGMRVTVDGSTGNVEPA